MNAGRRTASVVKVNQVALIQSPWHIYDEPDVDRSRRLWLGCQPNSFGNDCSGDPSARCIAIHTPSH